jgi:hypothetical protein
MGIGAPRSRRSAPGQPADKPKEWLPGEKKENTDPALFVISSISLVLLLALFIPAMRVLGTDPRYSGFGWGTAIGVGIGMAVVGTLFAYGFFGGRTWFDVRYYFWKRMLMLLVITAIFTPIVYFLMQWLLFPCAAIGLFLGLGAGFALALFGDSL